MATQRKGGPAEPQAAGDGRLTQGRYGWSVTLEAPFDAARERTIEALREEGFGVLTEIDVQKTMREKAGVEMKRYAILGACNPALAYAALQTDREIGLLLPCNVVIREIEPAATVVSILDPAVMEQLSAAPGLEQIGKVARRKLMGALHSLTGREP